MPTNALSILLSTVAAVGAAGVDLMSTSATSANSNHQEIISVFDQRVDHDQHWQVERKRLSGFRQSLLPSEDGARIRLAFTGQAVSLLRASPWRAWSTTAGQAYGVSGDDIRSRPASDLRGARMCITIDGRQAQQVDLAAAPVEILLAEDLADGPHQLELTFPKPCRLPVLGFRVLTGAHGAIAGTVTADAAEYLNDISVRIYQDGRLIAERLDRNPLTGRILVWGLDPGTYDLRLHALGWQAEWLRRIRVRPGAAVDFGTVQLASNPLAKPRGPIARPNRGHPIFVTPGQTFAAAYKADTKTIGFSAALAGPLNAYPLPVLSATVDRDTDLWNLRLKLPPDIPDGFYHLGITCSAGRDQATHAVCVRRQFGKHFRLVKFGHMDTWTQRNAQYLRLLAELTNLINPDLLLISNEVNWQYVAGALSVLRVPYLITSGNHGLPGFERYFGRPVGWVRAGDVFVANFGLDSAQAAAELPDLFQHAGDARYRIVQGVEPDLPEQIGRQLGVNLYAFGHGFTNEWLEQPESPQSPPWLHLGKEFHLVTIDLTTGQAAAAGVVDHLTGMAAKYPIPRDEPWSPVVFEPANDGRHRTIRATVRNPLTVALTDARLRFIMPAGSYRASKGRIIRTVPGEDGKLIEVHVSLNVPVKGKLTVTLSPATD